jgi:hypothetical protein
VVSGKYILVDIKSITGVRHLEVLKLGHYGDQSQILSASCGGRDTTGSWAMLVSWILLESGTLMQNSPSQFDIFKDKESLRPKMADDPKLANPVAIQKKRSRNGLKV